MDLRENVQNLINDLNSKSLKSFFRQANGDFRPLDNNLEQYLNEDIPISGLKQIGQIDFPDERQLALVIGDITEEITSRSGKKKQYELAVKVLKKELFDAGIFVFIGEQGHFRFSLVVSQYLGKKRTFTNYRRYTYFVDPTSYNRTFIDQVGQADYSTIEGFLDAFSVEKVTKDFFKKYNYVFQAAEKTISLGWTDEQKRLFTQRFFNRILFLTFLEKKGWLKFSNNPDYLQAIFDDYEEKKQADSNFHKDRLNILFFKGLNNPYIKDNHETQKEIAKEIGKVPYLNGGLFEQQLDDREWNFPDQVISTLLKEIVYRFNFTVSESTPMDVEVAVDPEMLGKIFEELVTGRHETGSYYTPKRIVSYMCRESIKYFLISHLKDEKEEGIRKFLDENNISELQDPNLVLDKLLSVKACDPACGSGAYLLGMLHEIIDLSFLLMQEEDVDSTTFYKIKLDIIRNNLYGVDIDSFAVNIAQLRLWLSLIVDYEGDDPPPLPNLDFKIEVGDSLLGPNPSGGLQPDMFRYAKIQEFMQLKNEFMVTPAGSDDKKKLSKKINEIRKSISEWAHEGGSGGFDWLVEFAEVFSPQLADGTLGGKLTGVINSVPGQMELVENSSICGFDIILANPPYVRADAQFKHIDNEPQRQKAINNWRSYRTTIKDTQAYTTL